MNGGYQTYTFRWQLLQDALTPDQYNQTPALRMIASHYLPYPTAPPTTPSGNNYPQEQSTPSGYLFESRYNEDLEGNPTIYKAIVVGHYQAATAVFNPVVLTEVQLPDGSKYKFTYNVYGEIDKVVFPTNAFEQYEYTTAAANWDQTTSEPYDQAKRRIQTRKLSADGAGGDIVQWAYSDAVAGGYRLLSVSAPDRTRTETVKFDNPSAAGEFGYQSTKNGIVVERRTYSAANAMTRRELTEYDETANSSGFAVKCNNVTNDTVTSFRNPRPVRSASILFEGSGSALAEIKTYSYDTTYQYSTGLDKTAEFTYNYTVVSNATGQTGTISQITEGSLARIVETEYSSNSAHRSANILGLPTRVKVEDASSNVVSQSEMTYDDSGYVPSGTTRGLPTTSKTWDSTKGASTNAGAYLITHATFDTYGNRTVATDAKGNPTTTTYDSTHAYPVSVTTAVPEDSGTHASGTAFTTSTSYDTTTGLVLSTTDINGRTTSMEYNDPLLRPTKVTAPNGAQTVTEYGAGTSGSTRWVKVKAQIDAYVWTEATSFYDGLGRTYKTQKTDTESADGDIYTYTCYDVMGRVEKTSNPVRNSTAGCTSDIPWTIPEYDDVNRTKKVTMPRASPSATPDTVFIAYGLSTSGVIGTAKTITDETGKQRTGITNALGNMVRVIEDPGGTSLSTDYTFDTLGNLRKTEQGSQSRYFMYDSLGRVLYARQVEQSANSNFSGTAYADPITSNNQWSTKYTYDDNSNIATTTDARNISITATYDRLNRLITRDYSDSTPDVTFYYDGTGLGSTPADSKGRTTKVWSSVSESRYTSFDYMGHVLTSEQRTSGQTYPFSYTYNLAGALLEETYPSGRVVKTTVNSNGQLEQVQSKKNASAGYWTYASGFAYNAAGAVTKMQLGNGHWETAAYNDRQQVMRIGLGNRDNLQDLLKLDYTYEDSSGKNNGSLRTQKIAVPTTGETAGFSVTQNYTYDALNRIQASEEKLDSNNSTTWKQTFQYDRYGNRTFDANNTTTLGNCVTAVCNPSISSSTNRITSSGYSYDSAGSVTQDAAGKRYGYDAEGRQITFFAASNGGSTPTVSYDFDGEGKRVRQGGTTFVYDAAGELSAEYEIPGPPIDGQEHRVQYMTNDHLGSPRIVTDANGAVVSRKDFTAFGEEVLTAQRGPTLGYNTPEVRQDYTGYLKDAESGLEYAQARYYNPQHGRFTSVDNFINETRINAPQSWNLYSYARNQPFYFTDPDGEKVYTGNITDTDDRDEFLRRLNFTYGCEGCVSIDNDGYLQVDTRNLSNQVANATQYLTNAINSTDPHQLFDVQVTNNNPDVAFGDSRAGAGNVRDASGVLMSSISIRLDFADDSAVKGDSKLKESFLNMVFAHEVSHFSPAYKQDPTTPGVRGDVDNPVNEIRLALGLPLRSEYLARNFQAGDLVYLKFGASVSYDNEFCNHNGPNGVQPLRGLDGLHVENQPGWIILWSQKAVKK